MSKVKPDIHQDALCIISEDTEIDLVIRGIKSVLLIIWHSFPQ